MSSLADLQTITRPIYFSLETTQTAQLNTDDHVIDLHHDLWGKPFHCQFAVQDAPATLADIVPVARALSSYLMALTRSELVQKNTDVPCQKGCAACCRYLIFLSIPEAFCLVREVMDLPEDRQNVIIQRSRALSQRLIQQLNLPTDIDVGRETQQEKLFRCYNTLKPDCPFLENEMCSIYDNRPVVCREHMVAGSIWPCGTAGQVQPRPVKLSFSIAETLAHLSMELEQTQHEVVILPTVFDWVQNHIERSKRTWPARLIVEQFIEILLRLWQEESPQSAQSGMLVT